MAIVDTLTKLTEWLNKNACAKVQLKMPADDGEAMDDKYSYELVTPQAFPLFVPAKDRLPPNVRTAMPSVCVQIMDGQDDLVSKNRDIRINLGFSCWNPGIHEKDIFFDGDSASYDAFINSYFPTKVDKKTNEEQLVKFRRTATGWMDCWNFIDLTLRELEQVDNIEGIQIVKDEPIKFGPYKEQETIPDYYPHWFGFIQFTVRNVIVRNNDSYEEFL